jgi:3-oxoacyl-[acyl-carrier protein] reductase
MDPTSPAGTTGNASGHVPARYGDRTVYAGLADRVVLLTGGAGGLGRALAKAYAGQGCVVALSDIDTAKTTAACDDLRLPSQRVVPFPADISTVPSCEQLVDRVLESYGRIDVLVNNAAIFARHALDDVTPEIFDRMLSVNLRAPFFLCRSVLPAMRQQRYGRIVNISSLAARTGGATSVPCYATSKGGLVALTRSVARAAALDGILVNAVLPSNIDTTMLTAGMEESYLGSLQADIPLGRLASPPEVAELVLWLSSESCSYVTGASYEITGGWMM